jgi:hypothetical protein
MSFTQINESSIQLTTTCTNTLLHCAQGLTNILLFSIDPIDGTRHGLI